MADKESIAIGRIANTITMADIGTLMRKICTDTTWARHILFSLLKAPLLQMDTLWDINPAPSERSSRVTFSSLSSCSVSPLSYMSCTLHRFRGDKPQFDFHLGCSFK